MVTRLAGAEAVSLQTQRSSAPAHSVAVIILEASDQLSHRRLHQWVAGSLPKLARFRGRLVTKPLGIGHPVWADIVDYDPFRQIHCATVRPPGGRTELADLVVDLTSGRLTSREQLWEAWTVDGLADGRWALVVKMSPALNDGSAGLASWWPRLFSRGPHLAVVDDLPVEPSLGPAPSAGELVLDALTELFENQVTGMWLAAATASGALQAVRGRLFGSKRDSAASVDSSTNRPSPQTVFNAPLTERRAVAFASLSLADARAVSTAFGGSVTNVVLAACTLSLRAWMQRYDRVPRNPLSMRIPFELPATYPPRIGPALAAGRLRIPVHLEDPVQVLANLHTATERLNEVRRNGVEYDYPAVDFATMAALVPPGMSQLAMQLYIHSGLRRQFRPNSHGNVSYIDVEPTPAYCAGTKVVGMYNLSPLAESSGLDIAFSARDEELDVSVCACPDNVPAVDAIANGIADSVDLLLAAAQESPRGMGPSVVTEMASHPANQQRGESS